jgi:hypothetical protein
LNERLNALGRGEFEEDAMPTGYTHSLEKMKYDVNKWLKENIIRAMGVCITLRDHGDMTAKQIAESLKKDASDSYHQKELKKTQAELKRFEAADSKLKKEYEAERDAAKVSYAKRVQEHNLKKAQHIESIKRVSALLLKANKENANEVTVGTLKFALEQLNSAFEFDYSTEPIKDEVIDQSLVEWKTAKIKKLVWSRDYHTKECAKEIDRNTERHQQYKEFIEFIDKQKLDKAIKK